MNWRIHKEALWLAILKSGVFIGGYLVTTVLLYDIFIQEDPDRIVFLISIAVVLLKYFYEYSRAVRKLRR